MRFNDHSIPGRPDPYTGRASNDHEALSKQQLIEHSVDLARRLDDASRKIERADDQIRELKTELTRLRGQLHHERAINLSKASDKKPEPLIEQPKSKAQANAEAFSSDFLHPRRFRGNKIPRLLVAIRDNPGLSMSALGKILGVHVACVSTGAKQYERFISRTKIGGSVHLEIRKG